MLNCKDHEGVDGLVFWSVGLICFLVGFFVGLFVFCGVLFCFNNSTKSAQVFLEEAM